MALKGPPLNYILSEVKYRRAAWMLLAADGDYRKVGNGTTTRSLRFVSILKSHHSSNRSH
jgi:hypothetical protein